ncbi:MAG: beta-ketoacyl-ACP synthase II [Gammaproteobacteria bacterium RIFCSPLOWO2_02_FULL_42_14]|nr:MAG: beta-ketoacyl-ACP synthase II [Gammaproteobacteria bacterium RIFCSPHIGHO2_02_FULL_42_43]OGT27383.1 MAG: beta-ketoacyl-ACP synthase II [Gammaproteobacteria bacterium RIFCSPHIGHO2_01_FULL_42_8]OGT52302.1 MAG: beta-ketoacyl-ACP synthase II [Gammaproteobacteria bacterium RIFCSPHIGHO2_12_FULL_41_25]OGT61914.1 MAG: beta-ketoacyl-ACP synthase II [Gammaproteobacteria bacterium RIFCSPLOWO2_02_FULL_42_14]OGT86375.1 MAG: beta-ketoacyl-ACP synthase II [Gammaproteobacteria bacterium RIFCSPLOWO2_12_F
MSTRVVITGMGGLTSLGNNWNQIQSNMRQKKTGVAVIEDWKKIEGLHTCLGGPILDFQLPAYFTRKQVRSMGRIAQLAVVATEAALKDANLLENSAILSDGRMGVAYGSCAGSSAPLADLALIQTESTLRRITASTYIKAMSHTCAVNIALFFKIAGRLIPTSSACTSSSQAIGYAYETIKNGYQDVMIAGGAEELCPSQVAVFDTLYATSQKNSTPQLTPKPFDKERDGLVIGEGACTLVLESLPHALARHATIYAEVVGFGTNCDANHITQPESATMQKAIELALQDAKLSPKEIGYICAHGTATEQGDIAESYATHNVFGVQTPISSLKSYFGHTLGACGAIEAWLSIHMMNDQRFAPTINLNQVDPNCATLDYIMNSEREIDCQYIVSNNFAFGGVNTSLIFHIFAS